MCGETNTRHEIVVASAFWLRSHGFEGVDALLPSVQGHGAYAGGQLFNTGRSWESVVHVRVLLIDLQPPLEGDRPPAVEFYRIRLRRLGGTLPLWRTEAALYLFPWGTPKLPPEHLCVDRRFSLLLGSPKVLSM